MLKKNVFMAKMMWYEDTVEDLSECLGIKCSTLRAKINGSSEFKRNEIDKLIVRWNLTPEETHEIFFSG